MERYSLAHLSDRSLLGRLTALVARDRQTTADLVAHLGEVEGRRLYRAAGYPSLLEYCVGELHLSEASAWRRIQVARAARKFPQLFEPVADGRLNLTSVLLLRPYFTPRNVERLIEATSHRTKSEIEHLIAKRFGPAELPPGGVGRAKLRPIAPGYVELRVVVRTQTVEGLRRAQDLMSHRNPTRNFDVVMDGLLEIGIPHLEKQKFGVTDRPRAGHATGGEGRAIPAEVRRAVYERDGGRCVFVSARGKRCESRHCLEYDHIVPVAKGGRSTVANLRLLCRAHNQLAAESAYGLAFMGSRIEEAKAERATGSGASCGTRSGASFGASSGEDSGVSSGASFSANSVANGDLRPMESATTESRATNGAPAALEVARPAPAPHHAAP